VEPFLVASTVSVIIGQRLVRKICEMCKASQERRSDQLLQNLPAEIVKKYFGAKKDARIYIGKGCEVCHFTGYSGRLGIFEVLEVTNNIKKLIAEKADSDVIIKQAVVDGMNTMLDDGLN